MATNEILTFASSGSAHTLTQAEYLADTERGIGHQPGTSRAKLANKALKQTSLIAAGVAQYIADNQANNITDSLTPANIAAYLASALSTTTTPPQFDNDTSVSTTAFVQRALGNFSGSTSVAPGSLSASNVGKLHFLTVTGSGTFTLPLASAVPDGATLFLVAESAAIATVSRSGSDTISGGGGSAIAFTLNPGDTAEVVRVSSTQWRVVGGTAALRTATGDFGRSIGTSGYYKLPGGWIEQWGLVTTTVGGGFTWTFPIAFPSGRLTEFFGLMPGNYVPQAVGGGTTSRFGTLLIANTGAAAPSGLQFLIGAKGN